MCWLALWGLMTDQKKNAERLLLRPFYSPVFEVTKQTVGEAE